MKAYPIKTHTMKSNLHVIQTVPEHKPEPVVLVVCQPAPKPVMIRLQDKWAWFDGSASLLVCRREDALRLLALLATF